MGDNVGINPYYSFALFQTWISDDGCEVAYELVKDNSGDDVHPSDFKTDISSGVATLADGYDKCAGYYSFRVKAYVISGSTLQSAVTYSDEYFL